MNSLATFAAELDGGARVHEDETGEVAGVSVHDVCATFGFSHRSWKRYANTTSREGGAAKTLAVTGRLPDGGDSAPRPKAVRTPMFTSVEAVRAAVTHLLSSSNKSADEIRRVAEAAGVEATVLACSYVSMPEKDVLKSLADMLPEEWGFVEQFVVGPYRLDAYIPEKRVAICVDEYGHAQYDAKAESKREGYLQRTLMCSFVRVDPIQTGTSLASMVRAVFRAVSNYDTAVERPLKRAHARLYVDCLYDRGDDDEDDGSSSSSGEEEVSED
jgi:hypothetical protein